jgi:hypothetical protein
LTSYPAPFPVRANNLSRPLQTVLHRPLLHRHPHSGPAHQYRHASLECSPGYGRYLLPTLLLLLLVLLVVVVLLL